MRINALAISLALIFLSISCGNNQSKREYIVQTSEEKILKFKLELIADRLISPVGMANAHDGSGRIFIISRPGKIFVIKNGKVLKEPFLDVAKKMVPIDNRKTERGLLGLVFHPQYKTNGRFFIYYSAPSGVEESDHRTVLAEYKVSAKDPDIAFEKEKIIMSIEQPEQNHNGGQMAFGPDGFLYIGLGDGGGKGDPHGEIGNAQDMTNPLGAILRIDVDHGNMIPYAIPKDNPFINTPYLHEIWAYGFRDPSGLSFDRESGRLYCGDVGRSRYEEINLVEAGKNYGWRAMEGRQIFDQALYGMGRSGQFEFPIFAFSHRLGKRVVGGFVYRGKRYPEIYGKYFFGVSKGRIFFLEEDRGGLWFAVEAFFEGFNLEKGKEKLNSFGEDEEGELYLITQRYRGGYNSTGKLFRLAVVK
ncbi:PQQ-dependent sugar dehydrogenase [Xanthovirga aplysinae]|uniref:PQQ-dependent sugar dehydrogenase n=1 Tax=Xanthovirga aplysinae TaxID=2529853 RepID=UPI0012BB702B|nr:PQQ-dependent sugar dehydrogenase [Xanthovirga aplysinae]MTI33339.1 glucose dehydrogenase [Xanthovirga aplysinae]